MMTENDFFEEIASKATTKEERIIRILQARGFLIHVEDGKYYLSDNASDGDAKYLKEGFKVYSLGKVEPVQTKDTLARLSISSIAEESNAIAFFKEKDYISFPITNQQEPWGKLKNHKYGEKVDVKNLEPFVARYVKAASACSVATNYSCDGNHKGQNCISVNAAYPFNIWHRNICEYIIPSKHIRFSEQMSIAFSDKNRFERYLLINRAAEYLYTHRIEIRAIKERACKRITASQIKHLTDAELEKAFNSAFAFELDNNSICWEGD